MSKKRGFELVSKYAGEDYLLPKRETAHAAGYDLKAAETVTIQPSVGVIDSDYYNNPSNEGLMYGQFSNITKEPITVSVGTRIMQGVFTKFLTVDNDEAGGKRTGGFGSTGK